MEDINRRCIEAFVAKVIIINGWCYKSGDRQIFDQCAGNNAGCGYSGNVKGDSGNGIGVSFEINDRNNRLFIDGGNGEGRGYGGGGATGDGNDLGGDFADNHGNEIMSFCGQEVYTIDGIPTIIYQVHKNIARGVLLMQDLSLKPCFIVKNDSGLYAHGNTIKNAIYELMENQFKCMYENV